MEPEKLISRYAKEWAKQDTSIGVIIGEIAKAAVSTGQTDPQRIADKSRKLIEMLGKYIESAEKQQGKTQGSWKEPIDGHPVFDPGNLHIVLDKAIQTELNSPGKYTSQELGNAFAMEMGLGSEDAAPKTPRGSNLF